MSEIETIEYDADGELARMLAVVRQMFGVPATPQAALGLVLMAQASLTPLLEVTRDQNPANVEWLLPNSVDAIERAAAALGEARDELESVLDDVGTIEPGTPVELVDTPRGRLP